jgi:predicted Na+-dependent transporter
MNKSQKVRQIHRWLAITFTVTVIITTIAVAQGDPAEWLTYLPLFPLAILLVTGLTMFVQPYTTKWRGRQRA